jgi:hypothetical protein
MSQQTTAKAPAWHCLTCTRDGTGPAPRSCPACLSEGDANHGPRAAVSQRDGMAVTVYRPWTGSRGNAASRPYWHATLPGACGSGWSAWEAIAEAISVQARRVATGALDLLIAGRQGGPDWVIETIVRIPGPDSLHVIGHNLNCAPGAYGREIAWRVKDVDDPRYEILPGAWDRGRDHYLAR